MDKPGSIRIPTGQLSTRLFPFNPVLAPLRHNQLAWPARRCYLLGMNSKLHCHETIKSEPCCSRRLRLRIINTIAFLAIASLVRITGTLVAAEPVIPKTPGGELVKQFIQVAQKGSQIDKERFVKEHYTQRFQDFASLQDHVAMLTHLSQDLKGASLRAFDSADNSVSLEFGRGDSTFTVKLILSADGAASIDGMMVGPGESSGATPPAQENLSEAEPVASVRAELEKRAADDKFSGVVLIARDGQPIFQAAYGYADRENRLTNTLDTKFRFGSMGKVFTGVAVLQLVQAGKITLDAPIARYLPDYPNKEVAAVTIYQLLTHTGGTGDIFSPEYEAHWEELKELKDYVALYGTRGLQFKPGASWDYSNYGFILLGRIIEVVSGQTYYDYVRDHIFRPAGMDSTDNLPEDQHVPGLSVGYTGPGGPGLHLIGPGPAPSHTPGPGGPGLHLVSPESDSEEHSTVPKGSIRPTTGSLPYRGTSAGGGYSTVGDLLKFVNALTSHKLLNAHYAELLITGKVATRRPGIKYAFGFEDELTKDGVQCFGHGGGSPGMNGRLSVFPGSNYVVVALANLDPPAADDMARFIRDRLPLK
jgi:D-alanyl-D-alanine carboxypeptidase